MLKNLHNEHVALLAMADEIRGWINHEALSDSIALAQCRWRMARTVTQHLAMEDAHVYGRLAKDPRPEAVAISNRFKREFSGLLGDINAHIAAWTADAVRADWPGYCREMGGLLDGLAARIRFEESVVYPFVFNAEKRAA